ncbi:hypothetical protein B0G57_12250 [Trinickia symbiotica]|nr:hypothetical protein [Trinickia symbiotica]PPK42041.1 hypothetical protein B0G57_12250 [Trinickia symbiotica]
MLIQRQAEKARYGRHVCVVAAAILALSIGVLHLRRGEQQLVATSQSRAPIAGATAFGLGDSAGATESVALSDSGLAIGEGHRLILNGALLDLIDSFLLQNADDDRVDQLRRYLKGKLPTAAYGEAVGIVERYQTYMKAHDDLLAAQNLGHVGDASAIDIDRIAIWRQQRDRLRRSILGDDIVQAWYQNDDAQLDQVLQEWRQRLEDSEAPQAPAQAPRYPVPHWHDKQAEDHHRQYMLRVLEKAVTSFADRRRAHDGNPLR